MKIKGYRPIPQNPQITLAMLPRDRIACDDKILIWFEGRDVKGKHAAIKRIINPVRYERRQNGWIRIVPLETPLPHVASQT